MIKKFNRKKENRKHEPSSCTNEMDALGYDACRSLSACSPFEGVREASMTWYFGVEERALAVRKPIPEFAPTGRQFVLSLMMKKSTLPVMRAIFLSIVLLLLL